ncbi:MAG: hypothetical protein RIS35_3040, partial [Pseudomonadota bacterium]
RTFPDQTIVQIAGNHEFYDGRYGEVLSALRETAVAEGVHFLENDRLILGGVRFLGCTLWTDHRVLETPGRAPAMDVRRAMDASRRANPDFFAIRSDDGRGFTPEDAAELHEASRAWLGQELSRGFDGPTVVVTHHLPSWRSVNPLYAASASNVAFVSDLDPLVERCTLWIHGHTHGSCDYTLGKARVVCNPRGYPAGGAVVPRRDDPAGPLEPEAVLAAGKSLQFENPAFDPIFHVDLRPT